jgi:[ribosomal protein S5]-alanine N-acetyltransferase
MTSSNDDRRISTPRLTLIAATLEHVLVELQSPERLAELIEARVSAEWPAGEYDRDAMEFFRDRLEAGGDAVVGWYGWYAVRREDADGPRALVGAGGYFGPPDSEGEVEIGYSVLPEWRRRGYAAEIARALVERAFAHDGVRRVVARTTDANVASVAVLRSGGFRRCLDVEPDGSARYEIARDSRPTT